MKLLSKLESLEYKIYLLLELLKPKKNEHLRKVKF